MGTGTGNSGNAKHGRNSGNGERRQRKWEPQQIRGNSGKDGNCGIALFTCMPHATDPRSKEDE